MVSGFGHYDSPVKEGLLIEEATISNMWEIAALVELLEQKDLCTKQDLHTIIASTSYAARQ